MTPADGHDAAPDTPGAAQGTSRGAVLEAPGTFEKLVLLLRRSKMVHTQWYLETYPDVAAIGMNPVEHFLQYGGLLRRHPGRGFDPRV
jgi:hypothetical protein